MIRVQWSGQSSHVDNFGAWLIGFADAVRSPQERADDDFHIQVLVCDQCLEVDVDPVAGRAGLFTVSVGGRHRQMAQELVVPWALGFSAGRAVDLGPVVSVSIPERSRAVAVLETLETLISDRQVFAFIGQEKRGSNA